MMQKILAAAAKAAISLALLYFAVSRVNLSVLADRLAQLRIEWLLAAVALLTFQVFVVALRWRAIARQSGAELGPARACRFMLIAGLFNQALPSTVGGDAARVWFLAREGAGYARSRQLGQGDGRSADGEPE